MRSEIQNIYNSYVVFICPPAFGVMGTENASNLDLVFFFFGLILANTILYGIVGMVFGWLWLGLRRLLSVLLGSSVR